MFFAKSFGACHLVLCFCAALVPTSPALTILNFEIALFIFQPKTET